MSDELNNIREQADAMGISYHHRASVSTIQKLIEDNKIGAIGKAIEDSAEYYKMQSFNQALLKLIALQAVTMDEALSYSPNPNDLKVRLQTEGLVKGGAYTGLAVDTSAPADPPGRGPAPPGLQRPGDGR